MVEIVTGTVSNRHETRNDNIFLLKINPTSPADGTVVKGQWLAGFGDSLGQNRETCGC